MKYKLSAKAKDDIWQIYQYTRSYYGEMQADKYYNGIFIQITQICQNPFMYSALNHIDKNYRRCVYHSHSIYYRIIENNNIEIIRIIGKQLPIE
jgi:toxin ParE1/3/4